MTGIEFGFIRPGEDNILHRVHSDYKIFVRTGPSGATHEDGVANQNTIISEFEANLTGCMSRCVDDLQVDITDFDLFPIL